MGMTSDSGRLALGVAADLPCVPAGQFGDQTPDAGHTGCACVLGVPGCGGHAVPAPRPWRFLCWSFQGLLPGCHYFSCCLRWCAVSLASTAPFPGRTQWPHQRLSFCPTQNVMPLSAGLFKSEHRNPVPQCPPRLHVQFLSHVLWSRMPNQFLKVDVSRVSERQGWLVQCVDPLQFMSLHIPEENRSAPRPALSLGDIQRDRCRGVGGWRGEVWGHRTRLKNISLLVATEMPFCTFQV